MKNRINKTILALFAGAALLTTHAHADVLFSDDFSASGSGSGWAAATTWSAGTLSGGEIAVTGAQSFRDFSAPITTSGMDLWLVSNMRMSAPSSSWGGYNFYNGTDWDLFFGSDSGSTDWSFDVKGVADYDTTIPNYNDLPTLLVAHITDSAVDMWINPIDVSNPAAMGTPDAAHSGAAGSVSTVAQWTRLRIGAGNPTVTVDDVTAATTFAEAIPESSTVLLFGFMSSAMLLLRRRFLI